MMTIANHPPGVSTQTEPGWMEATVAVALTNNTYLLDDGRLVQQAVSCVVVPAVGDRVLTVTCRDNTSYIVHLLNRTRNEQACLSVPGVQELVIQQPQIALNATEQVAIRALRDVEITATTGVLSLNARNLFTTVTDSLVENVRHYIGNVEQYLLDVKQLLRLHAKQTSMTAEQDVKVDAERISMG